MGYRVSKNPGTNLVTATFRKAYKDEGYPEGLIFYSDRGKHYTSKTFIALLKQRGVQQFFHIEEPQDNTVAETFCASLKKEEAYHREYTLGQSSCTSMEQHA